MSYTLFVFYGFISHSRRFTDFPDFVNASPKSEFVCSQSEKRLDGKVFLC